MPHLQDRTVPFDHIQGTTLNPPENTTVPLASGAKTPASTHKAPAVPGKEQKVLHYL
jgi:hypothetical protein